MLKGADLNAARYEIHKRGEFYRIRFYRGDASLHFYERIFESLQEAEDLARTTMTDTWHLVKKEKF